MIIFKKNSVINYEFMKCFKIIIFGESHYNEEEITDINKCILNIEPDFIMHEQLFCDKLFNKNKSIELIKKGICTNEKGVHCGDVLSLIAAVDCEGYGFDMKPNELEKNNLSGNFYRREMKFIDKLEYYRGFYKKICCVIGDTHLRKKNVISTPIIYDKYANDDEVLIIRSLSNEVI